MKAANVRVAVPKQARRNEVIELKVLIRHAMESGYRRDAVGEVIARDILKQFECRYNGDVVFSAEFFPAVAANPILTFFTRATESGTLEFRWVDQHGNAFGETVQLEVG